VIELLFLSSWINIHLRTDILFILEQHTS